MHVACTVGHFSVRQLPSLPGLSGWRYDSSAIDVTVPSLLFLSLRTAQPDRWLLKPQNRGILLPVHPSRAEPSSAAGIRWVQGMIHLQGGGNLVQGTIGL